MSYERPQNNDGVNGAWPKGQEGHSTQGAPETGTPRDGGPKGHAFDPSSEPPRYGVRVPSDQNGSNDQNGFENQGGQSAQQPWNSQQPWNQGQQGGHGSGMQQNQNPYPAGAGQWEQNNQNPYDQPYAAPPVTPGRGWAITSVVLGAISIVLFFLGITVILALLGIVFAIVAMVKAGKVPGARKGLAITGLILSILGLILCGIALVFWIAIGAVGLELWNDPAFQDCLTQLQSDGDQAAYQQCVDNVMQQRTS